MTPEELKASHARHVDGLAGQHLLDIFQELEEHYGPWAELMLRNVFDRMAALHRAAFDGDHTKVFRPPPKREPFVTIDSSDIERAISEMEV
jgi:hypothetical protein